MDNQTTAIAEQEVLCTHKPGEVWADGCCTSKRNKKTKSEGEGKADSLTDTSATAEIESSETPIVEK